MTTWNWEPPAGVSVGRGGYGTDPAIPMCPVCKAVGGGGHGGFCPNDGIDPKTWVVKPEGYRSEGPVYRKVTIEAVVRVDKEHEDRASAGIAYGYTGALVTRLAAKHLGGDQPVIGVDDPVVKFTASTSLVTWPEKPRTRKLVTAPEYRVFIQWCHDHGEQPGDWSFISTDDMLKGFDRHQELHVIGSPHAGIRFSTIAARGVKLVYEKH